MSEYVVTDTELTAVANAIRTKGGTQANLKWYSDFVDAIGAISGGGGSGADTYLPYSDASKVLFEDRAGISPYDASDVSDLYSATRFYVPLSAANTDVTCYCALKRTSGTNEIIFMAVPYANSNGNAPCFYCSNGSNTVECTIYSGNTALSGVSIDDWHVFALSINASTKKVRYFYDGVYAMEKTFNNSGAVVSFGKSLNDTYAGKAINFAYCGVVEECESDATIIANMQAIASYLSSGLGGGIEILTRSEWSALTTAQKQAKGKIAIEDYISGFYRGMLVNGADYDGHDQIVDRGFELYYADYHGNSRTDKGIQNNSYFVYFCHDNMPDTYTLNGNTYTYAINIQGYYHSTTRVMADTKYVDDNVVSYINGLKHAGSQISDSHSDSGSYVAIAGGWYGYPAGTVYQNAVSGISNTITLNEAHETLLVFVAASAVSMLNYPTFAINGVSYQTKQFVAVYDGVSSMYAAIQIDNNADTQITVTFGMSCYNYMSIIGID